jgi:hypothetical protein
MFDESLDLSGNKERFFQIKSKIEKQFCSDVDAESDKLDKILYDLIDYDTSYKNVDLERIIAKARR